MSVSVIEQNVIKFVTQERRKKLRQDTLLLGAEVVNILALSTWAMLVAEKFKGDYFYSQEAYLSDEQLYPGRGLAVVHIGNQSGVIVDFTSEEIIVGRVVDIYDEPAVLKELATVTGFQGWEKTDSALASSKS